VSTRAFDDREPCGGLAFAAPTSLDSSTASRSQVQGDLNTIPSDWNTVHSDSQPLKNWPTGDLDRAWSRIETSVKNVSNSSSPPDALKSITQAAQELAPAAQSTASELDGSSPNAPRPTRNQISNR